MLRVLCRQLTSSFRSLSMAGSVESSPEAKKYLIWFAQDHLPFRHAELKSLMDLLDVQLEFVEQKLDEQKLWMAADPLKGDNPWLIVRAADESHLTRICERSILIKYVIRLYGYGKSIDEMVEQLKRSSEIERSSRSYRFEVDAFGRRGMNPDERIAKMEKFDFLPFDGPIQLKTPEDIWFITEFYGLDPSAVKEYPTDVFFGKLVAYGQRNLIRQLSLKTREFIGNTSMDPTLSIIMSNMAQTQPTDLAFDPFVGSGSLLVAAAIHGAYVFGMDIDYMLLLGRAKPSRSHEKQRKAGECVRKNLVQYGYEDRYLDVIIGDSSLPTIRPIGIDSIITDPPYGIRESTERIGAKKTPYTEVGHSADVHIPSKVSYNLGDVISDLMRFAARNLNVGRRIVFWLPVYRADFLGLQGSPNKALPAHPCFELVACSEQRLSVHSSRMLCTYVKTRDSLEGEDIEGFRSYELSESFRDRYFSKHEKNEDLREGYAPEFNSR